MAKDKPNFLPLIVLGGIAVGLFALKRAQGEDDPDIDPNPPEFGDVTITIHRTSEQTFDIVIANTTKKRFSAVLTVAIFNINTGIIEENDRISLQIEPLDVITKSSNNINLPSGTYSMVASVTSGEIGIAQEELIFTI